MPGILWPTASRFNRKAGKKLNARAQKRKENTSKEPRNPGKDKTRDR
jgi:hypothetical protein